MTVIAKTPRELNACTSSGAAQSPHNCSKVIPFFPLRYAIQPADRAGYAYNHPNLERRFPVLKTSQYVLRGLRDDDGYLYIYDPDNREQILCFVYRSPDNGTHGGPRRPAGFQRLQLDAEFRATGLVGELLPFPYIPAYDHDPKVVVIWFADTLLSPAKLAAIHGNVDNLLTTLGTSVNLAPWLAAFTANPNPEEAPTVPHTLRIEDIEGQKAVGFDGNAVPWSEYPQGAHMPAAADMLMAQGVGSARLAVVLHDPVGIASELNHRIDGVLRQWSTYNEHAARLRWVSDGIEALGANVAREAELQALSNDAIGSALPPGVTGGAATAARDFAYKKGLAAKRKLFLDCVDEKARAEFLENDGFAVDHYQEQLNAAAADLMPWGASYRGSGSLAATICNLYDWEDAGNFVAGRAAVVRTLYGLTCCAEGTQELALQLTPEGPLEGSLLARALTGHPHIIAWATTRKILETTTDQIAEQALKDLGALVKEIKPDAASRQLTSLVMLALVKGKTPMTAQWLWVSRYAAMFEIAEGRLAVPEQIATRDVPQLLRREAKLTGEIDFRVSIFAQGAKDHITVIRLAAALEEAELSQARELVPKLASKLSLWHGTRLGLGGLSLLTSITNTAAALTQFTAADQSALVNSLNVTGNLLGIGGAARGVTAAVLSRQRDLAALSGKADEAAALRKLANSAERWAIALAAGSSLVTAYKDYFDKEKKGKHESDMLRAGIALQGAAAGLGFSHVFAKLWTSTLSSAAENIAIRSAGKTALGYGAERAAIWIANAPVALIITALQIVYTWNQGRADQAKIADWINQGCLGNEPTFDGATEQKMFYELFLKPKIDTSYKLGNIILDGVVPNFGPPRSQRSVAVLLPGWQPQVSAYALTQHVAFGLMTESLLNDPVKVAVKNGNGYLLLEAQNLLGDTVVRYWPNLFTQPNLMLEMKN